MGKSLRGETMATRMLKPTDAAWIFIEKREKPVHVASLAIFSLPEGASATYLQDLVNEWRARPSFATPFNLRLRPGAVASLLPAWQELSPEEIDLDYHFRHSALPKPGGERELGVLISRLHSHPLDRTRPLWECHIIEGLENNRFALYTKVHHSQIDGMGGMRLLSRILSPDAGARDLPPPWEVGLSGGKKAEDGEADQGSLIERLVTLGREQFRSGVAAVKAIGTMAVEARQSGSDGPAYPYSAPETILNGKIRGKRRFATQHYALDRIKRVAKAADATVNDIFLGLCAASVRRYLKELGELPDKPLTASVPVSVRPADDASVGNAITTLFANLHTDVADPVERIKAISRTTAPAKEKLQAMSKGAIENYTLMLMTPYMIQLMLGLGTATRPLNNLVISNVPGPSQVLYFNGARLEQIYPVSLLFDGQALNITVLSYAGQFNLGFTGDRDSLPHMQRIAVYTGEALVELERALKLK